MAALASPWAIVEAAKRPLATIVVGRRRGPFGGLGPTRPPGTSASHFLSALRQGPLEGAPLGEVAVVTGAGRGIGRAIAEAQAREGARVALLSRTAAEIEAVATGISDRGGSARAYAVDVVDLSAVENAISSVERDLGPINLLTNRAGAFRAIGPIWTVDPDAWWCDVETNVRGTFNCCRAALTGMIARKRGRIINLIGGGAATSFPHGSGYASSKAGLFRFTECLNDTLAGRGVLAFAMHPGLVRTTMTEYQLESGAGRTYLSAISNRFEAGLDVPPTLAARLSVEIGSGRFDSLAGRMLMAARGDLDLDEGGIDAIVAGDLRRFRVDGVPPERPYAPKV
jgi:NAD(P)-dependent dehydrogenase (short-subunit alcohol dehydrogenase family)